MDIDKITIAMFKDKRDNQPKTSTVLWSKLAERLMRHEERENKDGPLFSPVTYAAGATRKNNTVTTINLAVGDFDHGEDWVTIKEQLQVYEYVAYSTHSFTPDNCRFRVVIPLSKPVPSAEWPDTKARIDYHVFRQSADPSAKDQTHLYYLPSCPPNALRFAEQHNGRWLDALSLSAAPNSYRVSKNESNIPDPTEGMKAPLGKTALDFVANGAPLGEQRSRALAAARNYLSAGYSVDDTAAAIWRGLQTSPQDPDRGPWQYADASFIARNLSSSDAPELGYISSHVSPRSEMRKEGLGYRFEYPTLGISILVNHIRRSSSEFKAEVRVTAILPAIPHKLHWASLNLSSTSARGTLAKHLTKRTGNLDIDWDDILEDICDKVATLEREGQPFIELSLLPEEITSPWLIENFSPRGETTTLFGEGGSGKSMLALGMALSVQTGQEIIPGYRPLETGNVLYLDWETNHVRITRRARLLTNGMEMALPAIGYRRCTLPMAEQMEEVLRRCQEKGIVLVVIDSVEMAMAGTREAGGDANDAVLRLHAALRTLNVTAILVDHVNKASSGQPGKRTPYGGIFKTNLARMEYELRKSEASADGCLRMGLFNTKRNDDGILFKPVALKLDFGLGMACYGIDDQTALTPADGAVLALQIAAKMAYVDMTIPALAKALESDANTIGVIIRRMESQRQVKKVGRLGRADIWRLIAGPPTQTQTK